MSEIEDLKNCHVIVDVSTEVLTVLLLEGAVVMLHIGSSPIDKISEGKDHRSNCSTQNTHSSTSLILVLHRDNHVLAQEKRKLLPKCTASFKHLAGVPSRILTK